MLHLINYSITFMSINIYITIFNCVKYIFGKTMIKLIRKIVYIDLRNTCIRLCDKEWHALDEICKAEKIKRKALIERIKINKNDKLGLTPAIRLFTIIYYLNHYKNEAPKNGEHIDNILNSIK